MINNLLIYLAISDLPAGHFWPDQRFKTVGIFHFLVFRNQLASQYDQQLYSFSTLWPLAPKQNQCYSQVT